MMFFFRHKPLVLDCLTVNKTIFDVAKPDVAIKFIPDWWKRVPKRVEDGARFFGGATVKHCAGLINTFRHGFMLPMWSDLEIELGSLGDPYYTWKFSDGMSAIHTHPMTQLNNHIRETEVFHAKLISPWVFRCKEEVPWLWSSPTWNTIKELNYAVLPGVVEYKYQHAANVNLLFYRRHTKQSLGIPFGQPLVHVTPLTERKIKLKHHLVDVAEYDAHVANIVSFSNSYSKIKKILGGSK